MNVLITGANGFIGSPLTKELLKKYQVTCLARTRSNLRSIADEKVKIIFGDLHDKNSLKNAIAGADYIYHLAGTKNTRDDNSFYKDNFIGTKNILETVISEKIKIKRFIYVSSLAAYGPCHSLSAKIESDLKEPVDAFGESKCQAQQFVEFCSPKVPSTILIAPVVYGPADPDMQLFFKILKSGFVPQLQGKEKYSSFVHVKDLVKAMIMAAEKPDTKGQAYFIANEKPFSWNELARIILNLLGKKGIHIYIPLPLLKGYQKLESLYARFLSGSVAISKRKITEMKYDFWVCSSQKAQKELNWQPQIKIESGLKDTLHYYFKENLL